MEDDAYINNGRRIGGSSVALSEEKELQHILLGPEMIRCQSSLKVTSAGCQVTPQINN